jgi:hypothetical protein
LPRMVFSWCGKATLGCQRHRDSIECSYMATKTAKRINRKPAVRYIVDLQGQKTEAVLPISIYRRLLEQAEELEDIRHFDKAMKNPDSMPWEEAKKQLGL